MSVEVRTDMPEVDTTAVAAAAEVLGITQYPIYVFKDWTLGMFSCDGAYRGVQPHARVMFSVMPLDEPHHCIALHSGNGHANETLWHELAHALQCERDWSGDFAALESSCRAWLMRVGLWEKFTTPGSVFSSEEMRLYESQPTEVEAIRTATENKHTPLLRTTLTARSHEYKLIEYREHHELIEQVRASLDLLDSGRKLLDEYRVGLRTRPHPSTIITGLTA